MATQHSSHYHLQERPPLHTPSEDSRGLPSSVFSTVIGRTVYLQSTPLHPLVLIVVFPAVDRVSMAHLFNPFNPTTHTPSSRTPPSSPSGRDRISLTQEQRSAMLARHVVHGSLCVVKSVCDVRRWCAPWAISGLPSALCLNVPAWRVRQILG